MNSAPFNYPSMSQVYPTGIYPSAYNRNNGPISTVGKVIRLRPNLYVFGCDYCQTEFRTVEAYLNHIESHFQFETRPMTMPYSNTQVHSNLAPPLQGPPPPLHFPNYMTQSPNAFGFPPMQAHGYGTASTPVPATSSESIDITTSPSHVEESEDVFEIYDLGYDYDTNHTPPMPDNDIQSSKEDEKCEPKPTSGPKRTNVMQVKTPNTDLSKCLFCNKGYKKCYLNKHKKKVHRDILENLKVSGDYCKCLICGTKFTRTRYSEAEQHLATHYRRKPIKQL